MQHIMNENLLLPKDILEPQNLQNMTSISKNVYIDKLGNIVKKYNVTHHRTIQEKPVDVKSRPYINFDKEKEL